MRNITIRTRIVLLICIAVAFAAMVGGAFYYEIIKVRDYASGQTQDVMLAGEKDKLKLSVHALAQSLGAVLADLPDAASRKAAIARLTAPIRFEQDNSGYFFSYEGTVVITVPIKPQVTGKDLAGVRDKNGVAYVAELAKLAQSGGGFIRYVYEKPGRGVQPKLSYAEMIPGTNYWIGTGVYIDNIADKRAAIDANISGMVRDAVLLIAGVVAALLLVCVLPLSVAIFRSIVRPLKQAATAACDVAEGRLDVRLPETGRDEITRLESSINSMVETLRRNMEQITAKTREAEDKAAAAEQATSQAEAARSQAVRARREGLLAAAHSLEAVVERITKASEDIAGKSDSIGNATEVQKERITETATAMEQMNATVLEVAKNASQAADGAESASKHANEGNAVVGRSVAAMDELFVLSGELKKDMDALSRRAEDITQIMNVINDIADQTNLLALNAAIEAARAGDAGRGFAVVADEVRKLAEKTMSATHEVGDTVHAVQEVSRQNVAGMDKVAEAIAQSTELVRRSGHALTEILRMSQSTALQVQSIATAAEEQSAASEQINQAVEQINGIAADTAQGMKQTSKAIRDLAEQAEKLRSLVADLKHEGGEE